MTKQKPGPPKIVVSKSRLEFLFDGIFAIAMTILILEVKIPELSDRRSVHELGSTLWHHGSSFLSYFLGFAILGLLWYRHNALYRRYRHITNPMFGLHLLQLSMAAFLPFCAGTLGHNPGNSLSMVLYGGCLFVYQFCVAANWIVAHRSGALEEAMTVQEYRLHHKRNVRGLLVISIILVSYVVMAILNRGQ